MFFLFFSIYYFINALFFDEPTIHNIYEEQGFYNFIYLVPYIFYSFTISQILNTIIKYIFLSERNICKIKNEKKYKKFMILLIKLKNAWLLNIFVFFV